MTNERTELLECLDQLAKHIRAGETLNPKNAASIVEDAVAALRAHEPAGHPCHCEHDPRCDVHRDGSCNCHQLSEKQPWTAGDGPCDCAAREGKLWHAADCSSLKPPQPEPKAPQCGATVGEMPGFSAAECGLPAGHPGAHQWRPLNRPNEPQEHLCIRHGKFVNVSGRCPDCNR